MDSAAMRYGSDLSGLVWGYAFDGVTAGRDIDSAGVVTWLRAPPADAGANFIWLHFNLANAASEKWLAANLPLPDEFFEALRQGSRTTRIELADDTLTAIINDVRHDFSFDGADISTLWINVAPRVIVTARRAPLQSIERLRQAVRDGAPLLAPVDLLIHLLRDQGDVLVKIVRDAVARVDSVEDQLLAGRAAHRREEIGTLRRVLVRLGRLLAPEPAALFRLLQRPPAWMGEEAGRELRQSTEEFAVVLSDLAALQERIKLLQEEIAADVNEKNSQSLFVLTVVTVLALPINLIAGLLGMNVGGVPLAQNPYGFWIIAGVVATFTVVAAWLLLVRKKR
jgi:zinc transporter